jgi:hypothetical protein
MRRSGVRLPKAALTRACELRKRPAEDHFADDILIFVHESVDGSLGRASGVCATSPADMSIYRTTKGSGGSPSAPAYACRGERSPPALRKVEADAMEAVEVNLSPLLAARTPAVAAIRAREIVDRHAPDPARRHRPFWLSRAMTTLRRATKWLGRPAPGAVTWLRRPALRGWRPCRQAGLSRSRTIRMGCPTLASPSTDASCRPVIPRPRRCTRWIRSVRSPPPSPVRSPRRSAGTNGRVHRPGGLARAGA